MDIKLGLIVLIVLQLLPSNLFGHFEMETPAVRKIIKRLILNLTTIRLYYLVGHWLLYFQLYDHGGHKLSYHL
jgi:hypothetical protein